MQYKPNRSTFKQKEMNPKDGKSVITSWYYIVTCKAKKTALSDTNSLKKICNFEKKYHGKNKN